MTVKREREFELSATFEQQDMQHKGMERSHCSDQASQETDGRQHEKLTWDV